jgi:uncharacterized protein
MARQPTSVIYTVVRGRSVAFVDSSAWIALLSPGDHNHQAARDFFLNVASKERLLTSNYVISETVTWLIYHKRPRSAHEFRVMIEAAERTSLLTTAWVIPAEHWAAWDTLERYDDQEFSFCDCTSFVLAAENRVDYVFSFDRDFEIAGFNRRPNGSI